MFVVEKKDWVRRLKHHPIITPKDIKPSRDDFEVVGSFNAAAFEYKGRIGLLLRVAERPFQRTDKIRIPYFDEKTSELSFKQYDRTSPHINVSDPRAVLYKGRLFLTSVSHLRVAWSDDGINFTIDPKPTLWPQGEYETFGIEDPRVTKIGKKYYRTDIAPVQHGRLPFTCRYDPEILADPSSVRRHVGAKLDVDFRVSRPCSLGQTAMPGADPAGKIRRRSTRCRRSSDPDR